jgi:hypothetical protein
VCCGVASPYGLRVKARACGHRGGTGALGDVMQGEETLAAAGMAGTENQVAEVCLRLGPAHMITV